MTILEDYIAKISRVVEAAIDWDAHRIPNTSASTLPAATELSAAVHALLLPFERPNHV